MTYSIPSEKTQKGFFPESGIYKWLLLLFIFLSAFTVRIYNVDAPPLDFQPTRQYRSYLLTRAYYYESTDSVSESDKQIARAAKPFLLEPPITEYIVSVLYRWYGGERFFIPRLMSIFYWLIAAAVLYLLAKDLISHDAGIIAVVFFLFLPFGIIASRSFQPDPLMIMMFVASIYAVFKYYMKPAHYRFALLCVLSALAILIKPLCIFPIFGAFFAMRVPSRDISKIFFQRDLYIFGAVSVILCVIYYSYGIFIAGFLEAQAQYSFIPSLLIHPTYWKKWFLLASYVIGKWSIIFALIGVLLVRTELQKSFLIGLWIGYFIFGLVFTYHIHTHDYYHLMLIPIVALSLGVIASVILGLLAQNGRIWQFAFWLLFLFSILLSIRETLPSLDDSGFSSQVKKYEEIGELVNHSSNTLILDDAYGNGLMYHGRIGSPDGWLWPHSSEFKFNAKIGIPYLSGKELLDKWIMEISPEYFIASYVDDLKKQQSLKEELDAKYPKVVETPDYVIYDLKSQNINE